MAIALVALAFTWRRLFLGIDLNDEGFYVAVPYRFALGARPFVDEMNVLQTAQFFVYPFVKLYVWLTGGADGLVLFTRHLYLAWVAIVSLIACLGLKKVVRWEYALAASLVCLTFVFVSTTNLSYNTLGAGLLVIGMALGARAVVGGGRDRWLAAAGVAQALAVLAYPTLILALPVTAVCLGFSVPGRRRRGALRAWALGAGATLLAEALLLASFGVSNVLRCLRFQVSGWHELNRSSGLARLWGLATGVEHHLELSPLVVVAALVLWLAYRRWPARPAGAGPDAAGAAAVRSAARVGWRRLRRDLRAGGALLLLCSCRPSDAPSPPACWSGATCRRWRPGSSAVTRAPTAGCRWTSGFCRRWS